MKRRLGRLTGEMLKNLFRKPATVPYPQEELHFPAGYHGCPSFDERRCIGCGVCMEVCPADALIIRDSGFMGETHYKCQLNLGRCVFCGRCASECPRGCLKMSAELPTPAKSRRDMKKVF